MACQSGIAVFVIAPTGQRPRVDVFLGLVHHFPLAFCDRCGDRTSVALWLPWKTGEMI